jgi:hypothetical protein
MWLYQIKTNNKKNQDWLFDELKKAKWQGKKPILNGEHHVVVLDDEGYFSYNYNFGVAYGKELDMNNKDDFRFIWTEILKKKENIKQKFRAGQRVSIKCPGIEYASGTVIQILNKKVFYSSPNPYGRAYLVKLDKPIDVQNTKESFLPFMEVSLVKI